ncbi:MAG: choice-of-anchor L domain-containing protein [Flavobacteriales bacterium]
MNWTSIKSAGKWLFVVMGCSFGAAWGQISIESGLTLDEYVNEILLGEGVEAFNITYIGGSSQLGFMTNGEDDFSIGSGLVMSSDAAVNLACELEICNDCLGTGFNDPDLLDIANSVPPLIGQSFSVSSVNDGCVLEFDFVAAGDSVSFNYVFGSDEYETWVNTQYNDVFAFFLSGPGITGPYASPAGFPGGAVNIAGVPESDPNLPITISSVNSQTNSAYYIDNQSNNGACINGYTFPFVAEYAIECGETYHIKLAIADGSDTALESIVVLEEGSFSSNAFDIVASASINGNIVFGGDTTVVESCNDAVFQIVRPTSTSADTLNITITGTAENGVDYEEIDSQIIMDVGQNIYEIPLLVINDGIPEPAETVTIEYLYINLCGDSVFESSTLVLLDFEPILLDFESTVGICNGEVELGVEAVSGFGPFSYQWSTGNNDTLSTFTYNTNTPGTAIVTVTDVCGNEMEAEIDYVPPPPLDGLIDQLNEPVCPGDSVGLQFILETGVGPFEYDWSTGGDGISEIITEVESTDIFLTVTDACGTELNEIWPFNGSLYQPPSIESETVCLGVTNAVGIAEVPGPGEPGHVPGTYTWFTYQYSDIDVITGIAGDSALVEVNAVLDSTVIFLGNLGQFEANVQPGVIQIIAVDQCGSEIPFSLEVEACETNIPNVISPNADGKNDYFRIDGIEGFPGSELTVYNRWGSQVFRDVDYRGGWDGRINGKPLSEGTYYYILRRSDGAAFQGELTIVR